MRLWKNPRTSSQTPSEPVEYPSGLFVQTEKGYFYISGPGKRFRITTKRCLASWSPQRVIRTSEAAVANYKVVSKLKFRNGSLLHGFANGRLYLIENGKRRHITSPDAFERIGGSVAEAVAVSLDELNLHPEGEPLN